jgi:hypothetical protein
MQMLWLKGLKREVIGQVFEIGVFNEHYGIDNYRGKGDVA